MNIPMINMESPIKTLFDIQHDVIKRSVSEPIMVAINDPAKSIRELQNTTEGKGLFIDIKI